MQLSYQDHGWATAQSPTVMRHSYTILKIVGFVLFFILTSQVSYSQDSIYSKPENDAWLKQLNTFTNTSDKLNFVVEKIRKDASLNNDSTSQRDYIENDHLHIHIINSGTCKILFPLSVNRRTYILDLSDNPKYSTILEYITSKYIDSLEILNDISAAAIFGIQGHCGVVVLESKSKKLSRKMKNL